jgi:hypothetical protein
MLRFQAADACSVAVSRLFAAVARPVLPDNILFRDETREPGTHWVAFFWLPLPEMT